MTTDGFVPTCELRYALRHHVTASGMYEGRKPVLQQKWTRAMDTVEDGVVRLTVAEDWRDVPTVEGP